MRVAITKPLNLEELKSKLEQEFPGIKCVFRGKKLLVVSEPGSSAAAMVMARSNKAIVNEGFSTIGGQFLFAISIVLLGILIPFIIYMVTFLPKQKAIRNKIAEFIKNEYSDSDMK